MFSLEMGAYLNLILIDSYVWSGSGRKGNHIDVNPRPKAEDDEFSS